MIIIIEKNKNIEEKKWFMTFVYYLCNTYYINYMLNLFLDSSEYNY